jgi:hypothetical protein
MIDLPEQDVLNIWSTAPHIVQAPYALPLWKDPSVDIPL